MRKDGRGMAKIIDVSSSGLIAVTKKKEKGFLFDYEYPVVDAWVDDNGEVYLGFSHHEGELYGSDIFKVYQNGKELRFTELSVLISKLSN